MSRFSHIILVLVALILLPQPLIAKSAELIVIGSGDPIYTFWGHIGISIHDENTGEKKLYDFGNFSMYQDNFYRNFVMGRMMYLGVVRNSDASIQAAMRENRDVFSYPLNLGAWELEELERMLQFRVQPENREYLYDYFHNNCATVIRDILNQVLNKQIRNQSEQREDKSYRYYTRKRAQKSLLLDISLYYLLGPSIDKPISVWDLMFLPDEVGHFILDFTYTGHDGKSRTLADEKIVVNASMREPLLRDKRLIFPWLLLFGVIFALLWLLLPHKISGKIVRTLLVLSIGLPGLFLGTVMMFTDHSSTYGNINIWPSLPTLLLALIPLYIPAIPRSSRIMAWIWTVNFAGLLLSMVLSRLVVQDAAALWGFFFPITFAASWPGLVLKEHLAGWSPHSGWKESSIPGLLIRRRLFRW